MNHAEPVAAFGRSLGLEALTLAPGGLAQLVLGEDRSLTIESVDEELLIHLAAPVPFVETPRLVEALKAVNARRLDGPVLRLGLRGSGGDTTLIVLTRLTGRSLSGSDIARAVEAILAWHAQWLNS